MSAPCKAILIDPFACTVTQVECSRTDINDIYRHLSHPTMPVDTFELAEVTHLHERDVIFVAEQGPNKLCARWFSINGGRQPYEGKGFVSGTDERGFSKSPTTPLATIRERVVFFERKRGALLVTDRPHQG